MHARYAQYIHTATNMVEELHTYLYFTYLLWKLIWQLVLLCETLKLDTHTHTHGVTQSRMVRSYVCVLVHRWNWQTWALRQNTKTSSLQSVLKVTLTETLLLLKYSRFIFQSAETQSNPPHLTQWWIDNMRLGGVGDHSISLHQTKHPHRGCWWPYMSNSKTLSKTFPLLPPPPLYRTSMARLCHPIRHFPWGEWVLALTHQKWKALHTHSMCVEYVCVYCGGIVSRECHHEV